MSSCSAAAHDHMTGAQGKATVAATTLGSMLAFVDMSVVNVGLPRLSEDLHAGTSNVSWVVNAYGLPVSALILLGGAMGDHFGRRRLFLTGLSLFTAASLVCALAPAFWVMLVGRAFQGLGAALVMPNSLALLSGAFSGEERGRAIGTWAAVGSLAGVFGPVLGGFMIDAVGWRSIFFINVPVAAGAGYFASRYVEEQREKERGATLDTFGAMLITLALGLLTWSLTEASNRGFRPAWVGAGGLAGLVLAAIFVLWERKLGPSALMPTRVFSSKEFVGLNVLTFLLYGSLGGLIVLVPFLLIRIEHWSALTAGAALLPIPVTIGAGSRLMGRLAARIGARGPLSLGCLIVASGLALFAHIGTQPLHYWRDVFPPAALIAVGMGLCVAPLTNAVMVSVDKANVGLGSGINNAVARVAGLLATALLGFVFVGDASVQAFIPPYRHAAWIGAGACLLASVVAFSTIPPRQGRSPRRL
jgi:EmrB/QacA subfamily drug resistance transporter